MSNKLLRDKRGSNVQRSPTFRCLANFIVIMFAERGYAI